MNEKGDTVEALIDCWKRVQSSVCDQLLPYVKVAFCFICFNCNNCLFKIHCVQNYCFIVFFEELEAEG